MRPIFFVGIVIPIPIALLTTDNVITGLIFGGITGGILILVCLALVAIGDRVGCVKKPPLLDKDWDVSTVERVEDYPNPYLSISSQKSTENRHLAPEEWARLFKACWAISIVYLFILSLITVGRGSDNLWIQLFGWDLLVGFPLVLGFSLYVESKQKKAKQDARLKRGINTTIEEANHRQ